MQIIQNTHAGIVYISTYAVIIHGQNRAKEGKQKQNLTQIKRLQNNVVAILLQKIS